MLNGQTLALLLGKQLDTVQLSNSPSVTSQSNGQQFADLFAEIEKIDPKLLSEAFLKKLKDLENLESQDPKALNNIIPLLEDLNASIKTKIINDVQTEDSYTKDTHPEHLIPLGSMLIGENRTATLLNKQILPEAIQSKPTEIVNNVSNKLSEIIGLLKYNRAKEQSENSETSSTIDVGEETISKLNLDDSLIQKKSDASQNLQLDKKISLGKLEELGKQIFSKQTLDIKKTVDKTHNDSTIDTFLDADLSVKSAEKLSQVLPNLQMSLKTMGELSKNKFNINDINVTKHQGQTQFQNILQEAKEQVDFDVGNEFTVLEQLNDSKWRESVGERLLVMANKNVQSATIKLNPPELGPLEVKLNMKDNQANIVFNVSHGSIREAVENSIPRLREMFNQNGIDLANIDFGDNGSQQQTEGRDNQQQSFLNGQSNLFQNSQYSAETEQLTNSQTYVAKSLIDFYA